MSNYNTLSITKTKLDILKCQIRKLLSEEMLINGDIKILASYMSEDFCLEFKWGIAKQALGRLRSPKNWWQACKEQWYPKSFLKWWPVKYKQLDVYALYPKIILPKDFSHIYVQEYAESEDEV